MTCPKCQGTMRTVDRNGIHLEQCDRCHGLFLDHGELEQMVAAEQRYYDASPPPYQPPPGTPAPQPGHARYGDSPPSYRGGHYGDSPPAYGKRRKRSFLESLFD